MMNGNDNDGHGQYIEDQQEGNGKEHTAIVLQIGDIPIKGNNPLLQVFGEPFGIPQFFKLNVPGHITEPKGTDPQSPENDMEQQVEKKNGTGNM